MPEPNLIFPLPQNIGSVFEAAEAAESWVITSTSFLSKQKMLFAELSKGHSLLPQDDFIRKLIAVAAFSSFRDNVALLYALGQRQPRLFTRIIRQASGNGFTFVPAEYCGVLRWRIHYATAFSVMARVFSAERMNMICNALRRA